MRGISSLYGGATTTEARHVPQRYLKQVGSRCVLWVSVLAEEQRHSVGQFRHIGAFAPFVGKVDEDTRLEQAGNMHHIFD